MDLQKVWGVSVYPSEEKDRKSEWVPPLHFARGEFETVLVRFPGAARSKIAIEGLKIVWEKSKTGKKSPTISVKVFFVGSHFLKHSSFSKDTRVSPREVPEILIPIDVMSRPDFRFPSENYPSETRLLFDLYCDSNSIDGNFSGKIAFKLQSKNYQIPIQVTIYPYRLKKKFSLRTSIGFAPWGVLLKHFGKWTPQEMDLYKQYANLGLEHRLDFHKNYFSFLENKPGIDPLTVGKPSFFEFWESRKRGSVSSYSFESGSIDLPIPDRQKWIPSEKYWTSLNQSVVNHHLSKETYVYFSDEPRSNEIQLMREPLEKIHRWAGQTPILVTSHFQPILSGLVQIWGVNLSLWDQAGYPTPESYLERRKKSGDQFWLYTSCDAHGCTEAKDLKIPDLVMDREPAYLRSFPWMALRYEADGILYYDSVAGFSSKPQQALTPWQDSFSFHGYGEGNLFYPCNRQICGIAEPLVFPSLRLKVLRDGLEEVEIVSEAMKINPQIKKKVMAEFPNPHTFPMDLGRYDELKTQALEILGHDHQSADH